MFVIAIPDLIHYLSLTFFVDCSSMEVGRSYHLLITLLLSVFISIVGAHDGRTVFTDARLVSDSGAHQGIVEVLTPLGWFTLCYRNHYYYGWEPSKEPTVLCRQLGYDVVNNQYPDTTGVHRVNNDSTSVYYHVGCQGNETALSDCVQEFKYLSKTCRKVNISCTPCQENSVRLNGGLTSDRGNVEICSNGGWTGVCGYRWDYKDAFVVCRQLGLPATDVLRYTFSYFGPQHHPSNLIFNCFGNETQLTSCKSSPHSCIGSRIAGVYCKGNIVMEECHDGAIQLSGGSNKFEGRVEICSNSLWGTINEASWDYYDAVVTCRQIFGYQGHPRLTALQGYDNRLMFGSGTGPILFSSLNCNGSEGSLHQCTSSGFNFGATHDADVGVRCKENFADVVSCNDGGVRLAGGDTANEGRVEVCYDRVWGSVCDSYWSNINAAIVCQQLDFQGSNAVAVSDSYFGEGSGPYHLSGVNCDGHESNLIECSHRAIGYHTCIPGNDAGVICDGTLCTHGDVRLTGVTDRDGLAEVCINGYWAGICHDYWDNSNALIFCEQLFGEQTLAFVGSAYYSSYYIQQNGNLTLTNLNCSQSDSRIVDCSYSLVHGHVPDCYADGTARCYEQANCTLDDLRLTGGKVPSEGTVEICSNNLWGTIGDGYWNEHGAQVVCRQLGLPWEWAIPVRGSYFGNGSGQILGYFHGCEGTEENILDCNIYITDYLLIYNPPKNLTAGVICQDASQLSNGCTLDDVRLVDGSSDMEGRVEICTHGTWVTVCDYHWDVENTITICKQLGYPTNGAFRLSNYFSINYSVPMVHDLLCPSRAIDVSDCSLKYYNQTYYFSNYEGCTYERSVGVVCAERLDYNVTIEVEGRIEIGSGVKLSCNMKPNSSETHSKFVYKWYTSGRDLCYDCREYIYITLNANHLFTVHYYCYVYRSSQNELLGIGKRSLISRGLLYATIPMDITSYHMDTVILRVNTTNVNVKDFLRELAWYHNGVRIMPSDRLLLSQDNKTVTVLNITEDDIGVYKAVFEGLYVYPHNQYCEQLFVNLLRHYPLLAPVVFQVNVSGVTTFDIEGAAAIVYIDTDRTDSGVIPFTDGDNVTLFAKGYVSKYDQEVEQVTLHWYHNGKRKSSSSIFSVKDLHYNELLSLSHEFVIAESGFSEEGTYEAKLVVNADDYNLRCRPYYSSFMLSSNGFGSSQVVLSATEIELRYYDITFFHMEVDNKNITIEDGATITCTVSIKYPPLTSISLVKDGTLLLSTHKDMIKVNTMDLTLIPFGKYACVLDASGLILKKEVIVKSPTENFKQCPLGTYVAKLSTGDAICSPCPDNSQSIQTNSKFCICYKGYFRPDNDDFNAVCIRPPSACTSLRVIKKMVSLGENPIEMLIRWTRPEVTGSEGFYYDIYYSDSNNPETFSKQNERSFVSAQHHVEYLLRGMKVQTDYTIRVVVRNEVSDQDDENEHSRLCEANVTTRDVLPGAPQEVLVLCNIIVWKPPAAFFDTVIGYDIKLSSLQANHTVTLRKNSTEFFHVIQEGDSPNGDDVDVQIRAVVSAGEGMWSAGVQFNDTCC